MTKPCLTCGRVFGMEGFGPARKGTLGMKAHRECQRQQDRNRRLDPAVRRREKLATLKYNYGVTPERYEAMVASQEGRCAICGRPGTDMLAVDHDHACCPQRAKCCGKCVRGLLCQRCNGFLGLLEDQDLVAAAQAYREKYRLERAHEDWVKP